MKVHLADVRAIFGTSKAAVPSLLADWQKATLQAAIEDVARKTFQPEVDAALVGIDSDEEAEAMVEAIERRRLPRAVAEVTPHVDAQAVYAAALKAGAAHAAGLKDPFTPIARDLPGARLKEAPIWENARVMVLLDRFSKAPKALVIPKLPMSLPTEASPAFLDELAQVAAKVGRAFSAATGSAPAEIWINPPQHLTVSQLHVHVSPGLPNGKPTPELVAALERLLNA